MALIIDIETIGFPRNSNEATYNNIHLYDSARIVQLSMMVCNNKLEKIKLYDFIIKSDGFKIKNSHIHGITDEISAKGCSFNDTVGTLYDNLKQVSHIIAHNAKFDVNVLKSELFRHNLKYIVDEIDKKHILCSMTLTKNIVNAKNKYNKIKYPSLSDLYMYVCGITINNAHNAKYDVINLHLPIKKLYNDSKLFNDVDFIYHQQTIKSLLYNKYGIDYKQFLKDLKCIINH
jgi:DNA polymerase III epsilon subunit-like protein